MILDSTILGEIQEMLVEPNDLGLTWPSGLWSTSEVVDYLNQRQLRFLQETHAVVTRSTQGIIPATPRQPLPQTWIATRRIAFQPEGFDLFNGLISFWRLNEATGLNRVDSIGPNILVPSNGTTGVAGKIQGAAGFSAPTLQNLSITNAAQVGLNPGVGNFSLSFWVFIAAIPGFVTYSLIGKGSVGGPGVQAPGYYMVIDGDATPDPRHFSMTFGDSVNLVQGLQYNASTQVPLGQWNHIVATFTRNEKARVYLNNVLLTVNAPFSDNMNQFGATTANCAPTADFSIGSNSPNVGGKSNYLTGSMDAVGYWNRVLSADEVEVLWNGGAGRELFPAVQVVTPTGTNFQALSPGDQFEMDQSIPSWATSPQTRPTLYSDADPETLEVVLLPPSIGNGTLHFLFVEQPTTLTGLGVAFSVPDEFVPTLKWGVIEDMLGKIGRAHDPIRAKVASDLWDSGVFAAKALMEGFA